MLAHVHEVRDELKLFLKLMGNRISFGHST